MSNWKRKLVKDKATGHSAWVSHTVSSKKKYETFKKNAQVKRKKNAFGARQEYVGKKISRALASSRIRRRAPGAKRDALTKIGVLNPSFKKGTIHKSHLVADIFGAPSHKHNLVNEVHSINLGAHKRVENRIDKFIDLNRTEKSPLKRRGSMVVVDEFDKSGAVKKRTYGVHIDKGTGVEGYHFFTVTRKK